MQVAILAGGMGTRLRPMTEKIPKPMVEAAGKPFLEHEISLLKQGGILDYVLCVGYRGEQVEEYFGDGRRWGVRVRYSYDGEELMGAAGALKRAEPLLHDRFFVTYGDAYLRADYRRMMAAFVASGSLAMMAVLHNKNRYGNSDLDVRAGRVVRYDKKAGGKGLEWVNFGVSAMRKRALDFIPKGRACGEEEFYGKLIERGELRAYPVRNRFYEIGTPKSLAEFERFFARRDGRARRTSR